MARAFAVADLHGRYDLYLKIKEYLQPDDLLFCLGDCIDRGPDGMKIVKDLMARPHTTYICGNHESMAARAIPELPDDRYWVKGQSYVDIWFRNGGEVTYESIENESKETILSYAEYFDNLPLRVTYIREDGGRVIMTHAGYTPNFAPNLLWDRESFNDPWPDNFDDTYIIHGHTPVHYLEHYFGYDNKKIYIHRNMSDICEHWDPRVIWYANHHKCDIDMGSVFSNQAVLLNLDTWEEIYFKIE